MKSNTLVRDVYYLLGAGVHLGEILRYNGQKNLPDSDGSDAPVDSGADTIPAPPPSSVRRFQARMVTEASPGIVPGIGRVA